ncbi:MAG: ATP-binding protein [Acidimicrobiales bacterium]
MIEFGEDRQATPLVLKLPAWRDVRRQSEFHDRPTWDLYRFLCNRLSDSWLLPVATETAEALYRVVDAAYEKRAIALSSNQHPAGFDELMPKTIANATVDRLMHHAHVVITNGDSIRLTHATAGKGVTPLT